MVVCSISWEILLFTLIYRLIIDNNETNTNIATLLHAHPCTVHAPRRIPIEWLWCIHFYSFALFIQHIGEYLDCSTSMFLACHEYQPKHNNDARLIWKNEYDVHECVRAKWNYAVTYDFIRCFTENRTQFPLLNKLHSDTDTGSERMIFLWIQMRFKRILYCVKVHIFETSDLLTSKRHGENGGETKSEWKGSKMTTINVTENLRNLLWENVRVAIHCMHKSPILFV